MMVATKAPREEEMRNVTANVMPTAVGVPMEAIHETETEINMSCTVCSCMTWLLHVKVKLLSVCGHHKIYVRNEIIEIRHILCK